MADQEDVRRLALAQPGAREEPHHHRTSFRVRGRIFATMVPGDGKANLALPPDLAVELIDREPDVLSPIAWGSIEGWVSVELGPARPELLEQLIAAAWTRVVPRSAKSRPDEGGST